MIAGYIYLNYEVLKMSYKEEFDDFEEWEDEAELFYAEDWEGLIKLRVQKVDKSPDDIDYLYLLGEAYVLGSEFEKAIKFLYPVYKRFPEHTGVQRTLLEALFKSGKDETAIEWINTPKIINLGKDEINFCYDFLKNKRKARDIHTIYYNYNYLYEFEYMNFNEQDLYEALKKDKRFVIENDTGNWFDANVSVVKTKNK